MFYLKEKFVIFSQENKITRTPGNGVLDELFAAFYAKLWGCVETNSDRLPKLGFLFVASDHKNAQSK